MYITNTAATTTVWVWWRAMTVSVTPARCTRVVSLHSALQWQEKCRICWEQHSISRITGNRGGSLEALGSEAQTSFVVWLLVTQNVVVKINFCEALFYYSLTANRHPLPFSSGYMPKLTFVTEMHNDSGKHVMTAALNNGTFSLKLHQMQPKPNIPTGYSSTERLYTVM